MKTPTQSSTHHLLSFKRGAPLAAISGVLMAASLAFALPAQAQTPETSAPAATSAKADGAKQMRKSRFHENRKAHHQAGKRGHYAGGIMVPGYGILNAKTVDALKLSDDQKKLVEEARQASQKVREQQREQIHEKNTQRKQHLAEGKLDPRQALKAREADAGQWINSRQEINNKWLSVWDSLSEQQKAVANDYFKQRTDKAAKKDGRSGGQHKKFGPRS